MPAGSTFSHLALRLATPFAEHHSRCVFLDDFSKRTCRQDVPLKSFLIAEGTGVRTR